MWRLMGLPMLLALSLAALLAACGNDDDVTGQPGDDDGGTMTPGEVQVLRADVERSVPDADTFASGSGALQRFASDLYAVLAREEGNLAFSPYSVHAALAMTRAGAEGETLEQMSAVLHAAQAGDLDALFNAVDQALRERSGEYDWVDQKVELELAIANQLWGQRDYPFHDPFLEMLAAQYGAAMRLVDYMDPEAREGARAAINQWVAEQTADRIPELVPDGVLNEYTRLVLTNAVYLNAPWMHRFDPDDTATGPFTRLDGSTVDADMMALDRRLRYAAGGGYQAVELPYVDGSLAMVVVVPDEGEFAGIEEMLMTAGISGVLDELEGRQVDLRFPRFEFRTQLPLKQALGELGMPVAFDEDHADFSRMAPGGDELFIVEVLHEAFIAVDEHGTEAAAATAVVVQATSASPTPVSLSVDRPFVFFIHDQETGAILFMGRVLDPMG